MYLELELVSDRLKLLLAPRCQLGQLDMNTRPENEGHILMGYWVNIEL